MLQNRHLKLVLAAAFLLLSACTLPSTAEPEPDPIEVDPGLARALDGSLAEILTQAPAPGLTAAIQFSDGSRWSGAAGTTHPADHPEGRAMAAEDRFNIASITKSFVGGLVLKLVDEGLLSLDDSFERWLPGGHPRGAEITVQQLLQHTAGVPGYMIRAPFQNNYTASWTDEELLAIIDGLPLLNEPGAAWAYSNSHFIMLSLIVSAATGQPWREALQEQILQPNELSQSLMPATADGWGDIVPSWLGDEPFPLIMQPSGAGAAGGMVSGAEDLARWTQIRFGGNFLSTELNELETEGLLQLGGGTWAALGAVVVEFSETGPQHGHDGALNGYVGWSGYRPDIDASISLLGNAWGEGDPPDFSYPLELHLKLWEEVDAHLATD